MRPIFYRSLDHFLVGYPKAWRREDASLFWKVTTGYVHSLAALVRAGCDVVAEAVIIPEQADLYRQALADTPVLLVGVRCRLEVAQRREAARTDRGKVDLDVPWFESVHHVPYDAEVDTSDDLSPSLLAAPLVQLFDNPPPQRAFSRFLGE